MERFGMVFNVKSTTTTTANYFSPPGGFSRDTEYMLRRLWGRSLVLLKAIRISKKEPPRTRDGLLSGELPIPYSRQQFNVMQYGAGALAE